MTVKMMVALYVQSGLSEKVWDALFRLMVTGSISKSNWIRFRDTCGDWYKVGNIIYDEYASVLYRLDDERDVWVKEEQKK